MIVTFTALAPIAHGAFGPSTGNAQLIRRLPVGNKRVPVVSGNALRGVLRRIAMRDALALCGLSRETPGWDDLYAAVVNGGHLRGAETGIDPQRVRDLRAAVPALSLFGAALQTWMLPGRMSVGIVWPVDRDGADASVHEMSHVRHIERDQQNPERTGVTPMPTTIEVLPAGTVLRSEILFDGAATQVERAVVPWALGSLTAIGAKSAAGLGRVCVEHDGDGTAYAAWRSDATAVSGAGTVLQNLATTLARSGTRKAKTGVAAYAQPEKTGIESCDT